MAYNRNTDGTAPSSLTDRFNVFGDSSGAKAESTTPQESLESTITQGRVKLTVERSQQKAVNPNKPNAQAAAQKEARAAEGANNINKRTIAAAEKEIKAAAGEALAAEKAVGKGGQAYAARGSEATAAGLAIAAGADGGVTGALASAAMGKGTLGAKSASVLNGLDAVEMVQGGSSVEEAVAKVEDALVQSSLAPAELDGAGFGMITQAGASDTVPVNRDWGNIIEQHGKGITEAIVAYNPDNPSEEFAVMRDLKNAVGENDRYLAEMENVEAVVECMKYSADGVEIAGELPNGFPVDAANADSFVPIASLDASERNYLTGVGAHIEYSSQEQDLENGLMRLASKPEVTQTRMT